MFFLSTDQRSIPKFTSCNPFRTVINNISLNLSFKWRDIHLLTKSNAGIPKPPEILSLCPGERQMTFQHILKIVLEIFCFPYKCSRVCVLFETFVVHTSGVPWLYKRYAFVCMCVCAVHLFLLTIIFRLLFDRVPWSMTWQRIIFRDQASHERMYVLNV